MGKKLGTVIAHVKVSIVNLCTGMDSTVNICTRIESIVNISVPNPYMMTTWYNITVNSRYSEN